MKDLSRMDILKKGIYLRIMKKDLSYLAEDEGTEVVY